MESLKLPKIICGLKKTTEAGGPWLNVVKFLSKVKMAAGKN